MKKIALPFLILIILSFSTGEIIYGDFDFVEIDEINNTDIDWKSIAKSVAIFTSKSNLLEIGNGYYKLKDYTLRDELPKLKNHPFIEQPAVGFSTAFLVAKDKLMTAGHTGKKDLKEVIYLFDYEWDSQKKKLKKEVYHESEIYRCKKILTLKNSKRKGDFAVLQIDKETTGRIPLVIKNIKRDKIIGKSLVMIGSPDGVPLKFTKRGAVWKKKPYDRMSKKKYFLHNLDVSAGSSGAPIFLKSTGEVIGIQSGGDEDYTKIGNEIVIVKGDFDGKNSNLNRDLTGEHGSLIPEEIIELIKE